ncbi:aldehyde dehydrogenase (NADP(+)) [Xanthovirga aplysinae]|uniref:aldehyde dehydrogenase (NADP(+)) n=1 Tax=Xanthovirga aplysinae TaxID=2529853 RepID=UPI0012BBC021|nr:aldehyde dehydrogenase (NADP(+)) [Xanthovirga aplysinae]MTI30088.1 aldehyde dehydrogenase (NADP(+)) [Xanthovirga aplysinae]
MSITSPQTIDKKFASLLSEEVNNTIYEPETKQLNQLLEKSRKAYEIFKNLSGEQKASFLEAIGEEIAALGDNLVQTVMKESSLPEGRVIGERGRTVGQLNAFAQLIREGSWVEAHIDTAIPDRQPLPKPDVRKMLRPIGPVVVFGASNFPLAFSTAGGDTASALAAGNPVIVKAHEGHPATSELVALAIQKAAERTKMPDGVFSMVYGGIEAGQILVKHPVVKAIGFTGSGKAGRALYNAAAQREEPIPVFAEMGSTNPVLLLPSTLEENAENIAKIYAGSITLGTGQFCTSPGILIGIDSPSLVHFRKTLAVEISKVLPSSMLNKRVWDGFQYTYGEAKKQDGVQLLGVSSENADSESLQVKAVVASVKADDFIQNSALKEEVFGPYSLLVVCDSSEKALEVINSLEGQLTATIMGEESEMSSFQPHIEALQERVGRLIFNGVPTGVEVCPSMHHGGPFPSTSDSKFSSVGTSAIKRFARPVCYQGCPQDLLPNELKDDNPLKVWRTINGDLSKEEVK